MDIWVVSNALNPTSYIGDIKEVTFVKIVKPARDTFRIWVERHSFWHGF